MVSRSLHEKGRMKGGLSGLEIHENSDIILNRWYEIFGDTENDEDDE